MSRTGFPTMAAINKLQRSLNNTASLASGPKGKKNYNNTNGQSSPWDYSPKDNVLKLSIYSLVYAFYNDDGVLTLFEKSKLMRIVKKAPYSFSKTDRNELKKYMENNPTKEVIVNYMKKNELSLSSLTLAFKLLGSDIVKNARYKSLFDSLRNHVEALEK